jgi:xanthine/CO dehydrogenase XdhC/CoxF family maturation factor
VSILAQIIMLRRGGDGQPMKADYPIRSTEF